MAHPIWTLTRRSAAGAVDLYFEPLSRGWSSVRTTLARWAEHAEPLEQEKRTLRVKQANLEGEMSDLKASRAPNGWRFKTQGYKMATMWSLAAVFGAVTISLANAIGVARNVTGRDRPDDPWFVLIRLAAPVTVMLVYAWNGNRYAESAGEYVGLRAARIAQLADSLYFLGFLWTLWALIDCFVIHQMSIAEAVFRAFGYALITTATGMFLRLLLLQFKYSDEQMPLAEEHLEEQMARFTVELNGAVSSLLGFRTRTDEALTGWINSINGSCGILRNAVQDAQTQTSTLKDTLSEVHRMSVDHVGKVVQAAVNEFTAKVQPSLTELNGAHARFVRQVDENTTGVRNAVAGGIRSVDARMQAGASQLDTSLRQNAQTIVRVTDAFSTGVAEQLAAVETNLAAVAKQIQQIRVPVDVVERSVAQQVAAANSGLAANIKAFEAAINELRAAVQAATVRMRAPQRQPWWNFWKS
jgi:hypothetical protein